MDPRKKEFRNIIVQEAFAFDFPKKNDTMYLSTIKNKKQPLNGTGKNPRDLLSLTTNDIVGASPTPFYKDLLVKDFDSRRFTLFFLFLKV